MEKDLKKVFIKFTNDEDLNLNYALKFFYAFSLVYEPCSLRLKYLGLTAGVTNKENEALRNYVMDNLCCYQTFEKMKVPLKKSYHTMLDSSRYYFFVRDTWVSAAWDAIMLDRIPKERNMDDFYLDEDCTKRYIDSDKVRKDIDKDRIQRMV